MAVTSRDALQQFLASSSGRIGSAFLLIMMAVSIYVLSTYPLDFGTRSWSNPEIWADNPKAAPPTWVNLFSSIKKAEHLILQAKEPTKVVEASNLITYSYIFTINYQSDEPPTFTSFTLYNVVYNERPPIITLTISRPDDREVKLYSIIVPGPASGERSPIKRYYERPLRILLSGDSQVAYAVSDFILRSFKVSVPYNQLLTEGVDKAVFGLPEDVKPVSFSVLKGVYKVKVEASLYDRRDSISMVRFVIGGSIFGVMGTDGLGRDLAVGLLFGFPVALFIGLVTSTLVTLFGAMLGIASGYIAGKTDTMIQRGSDILLNMPLLPFLIFLTFVLGQKLWIVIVILIAFGWPGLTIVVRSMVLQIKSGQFIEAAKALGASSRHIMLRHIFPQTAPFVFAQLVFFTPGAILAEAAVSFLGLGDPSIPTWGQILEYGFRNGGIYVGYWWWILPPGLLIVSTAMTFVLIALGLEPIVNPRLRRMA